MATTKKTPAAPEAADAPDQVFLKCEVLGIDSQAFSPDHAEALFRFQAAKGLSDWQPVDTTPAKTDV